MAVKVRDFSTERPALALCQQVPFCQGSNASLILFCTVSAQALD